MSRLSVLIPTIVGREAQFHALCGAIPVEVTACYDNKEMSIGAKRQHLLEHCKTEYFVMIDDDDSFAHDYFDKILPLLESNPDCICYLEKLSNGQIAIHSNRFEKWGTGKGYDYYRTPFYKDVLRTDIALQIGFADMRYGEDHDFSKRLKASGLIKNEIFINEPMYFYNMPGEMNIKEHKKRYGIK